MESPPDIREWIRKEDRFWDQAQSNFGTGRRGILGLAVLFLLYLLRSFTRAFSFQ